MTRKRPFFSVHLETVTSDVSDLERRVHDYSEQLKAKKKELERLKRRNKELLRRQETELKRQIDVKTNLFLFFVQFELFL